MKYKYKREYIFIYCYRYCEMTEIHFRHINNNFKKKRPYLCKLNF